MSSGLKGFEEKKSTNSCYNRFLLELGETDLLHQADSALGKTKQSEPEPPPEAE